ncbi:uncharacterized protein LOC118645380 [Monomorium pharaonis]|uniref:uncharacterized protein LOC118645380 n=1 Tax=Monomorium pharaonis TaxID=307658 RepID=UPI001746A8F1|nr:uncharacterized protein LOC118645380 [Monomorium pharaonis]
MAEIGGLRKARGYIKAKLTRLRTAVFQATDNTDSEFDKAEAETRLEALEEIYRDFKLVQRQLLEMVDEFTADDTAEDEIFENRYFQVKALLKRVVRQSSPEDAAPGNADAIVRLLQQQTELIRHIGRDSRNDDAAVVTPTLSAEGSEVLATILSRQTEILDRVANASASGNAETRVKLPTIKLPRFDGKIEEWKYFYDNFRSIIHDKSHLSNIEKFQYLSSSISGDAAKIIESIELTGQNYNAAWELLQQRYDDPRSLKKKHIECLFSMPTVVKESAKALRDLVDYTSRHLRMLKVLGLPTDTWDDLIVHMMENRFDVNTLRAWEEETETSKTASLTDMLGFLKRKCQTLERIESRTADKIEKSPKDNEQRSKGHSTANLKAHSLLKGSANQKTSLAASVNSGKCHYCEGSHFIYFCDKFLDLSVSDRIKEVKRLKLCINCLRNDHYVRTCRMGTCRECSQKHNTLCHQTPKDKDSSESEVKESPGKANNESSVNVAVHHSSSDFKERRILMATAIVEAIRRNGSSVPIRVLLDSASEANFITQSAHNRLGLKRTRVSEVVTGINEAESQIHNVCEVHVKSKCSSFEINAQCLIIPKITKNLPSTLIDHSKLQIPSNLTLADPEFYKNGPVDMLIGAEFFFDLLKAGKLEIGKNQLVLHNTTLGWIVAGSIPSVALERSTSNQNKITCSFKTCEALCDNMERFWELERYDDTKPRFLSSNEKRCEQHFEQNTERTSDGRFIVKLPFREDVLPIGNNREIALKRFNRLERTLMGNTAIRDRYTKFMREYEELEHMSVVDNSSNDFKTIVYLPHHGVLKESSSTTKLRVVFDASAKNNKGVALNDALLVGPVLQDNLVDIIIRFRFYKVALVADLQKMYRQVLVHSSDRDYQRILWRFEPSEPIREYRLNTVTYGQACASYLAIRCLRQLATEGSDRYPLAAHALLNDVYVDDIIVTDKNFKNRFVTFR